MERATGWNCPMLLRAALLAKSTNFRRILTSCPGCSSSAMRLPADRCPTKTTSEFAECRDSVRRSVRILGLWQMMMGSCISPATAGWKRSGRFGGLEAVRRGHLEWGDLVYASVFWRYITGRRIGRRHVVSPLCLAKLPLVLLGVLTNMDTQGRKRFGLNFSGTVCGIFCLKGLKKTIL